MDNSTAGSSECYWFEWETGVVSLIELLDPDSEASSVAFQLSGVKGWDDVAIRFKDGRTRLIQAKHTRNGSRMTFGDLVSAGKRPDGQDKTSLLRSLANAWKSIKADYSGLECCLYTNRESGVQWWNDRPPLTDFFDLLSHKLGSIQKLSDISWKSDDERYAQTWPSFLGELSDLDDDQKLEFLRAFELETNVPDLDDLEASIYKRLEVLSGLSEPSVRSLFNAVFAGLRRWTAATRRESEWVSREELLRTLSNEDTPPHVIGNCSVETPEPFFPSRLGVVNTLSESLLDVHSVHKIDYLSAVPGEGKTSCISRLARIGVIQWSQQVVSVRYYAYRPIRPDEAVLPDDGGDTSTSEALWKSLLWQIRDNLRRTRDLSDLRVPAWIDGMPWEVARAHVLRIASKLGEEWNRPFVICIDGIDHAARARRRGMREFLKTIPTPDSIPDHVRLLLSGQPSESYPEYPHYLKGSHDKVRHHSPDSLDVEDIELLVKSKSASVLESHANAIARYVGEQAKYRTLSVVYLVEAGRGAETVGDFLERVDRNPIPDSLHDYYENIWTAADVDHLIRIRLASSFVLLKERPSPEMLSQAFHDLGKSAGKWRDYMRRMRPIMREADGGFELVHNDVRIYLEGLISVESELVGEVASAFVDYYRTAGSNRKFAQITLLELLERSGRIDEFADVFTSEWVLEAARLGFVTGDKFKMECHFAFSGAIRRRDWNLLHRVACASLTVYKIFYAQRDCDLSPLVLEVPTTPAFLSIEGEALPMECWELSEFYGLIHGLTELWDANETERVHSVLRQTLGDMPLGAFISTISKLLKEDEASVAEFNEIKRRFERLGYFYNRCYIDYSVGDLEEQDIDLYVCFEKGWCQGFSDQASRFVALRQWAAHKPKYLQPWMEAARHSYTQGRLGECRALLNRLVKDFNGLGHSDRIEFGFWAERSGVARPEIWSVFLGQPDFGLGQARASYNDISLIAQWTTYTNTAREPAQLADDLIDLLDQEQLGRLDSKGPTRLIIRANAVLGLVYRCLDSDLGASLEEYVSNHTLRSVLTELLMGEFSWDALPHEERSKPRNLGVTLISAVGKIGCSSSNSVVVEVAKAFFEKFILQDHAEGVFNSLLNLGEELYLTGFVQRRTSKFVAEISECDPTQRRSYVTRLINYFRLLNLDPSELIEAYDRNLIGYNGNDDWTFHPVVQQIVCKLSSGAGASSSFPSGDGA